MYDRCMNLCLHMCLGNMYMAGAHGSEPKDGYVAACG